MRLREIRKERNLLQKEIAQAIGVSTQSYGYYENGINKPDPDTLIRLADFFECSVDYLIGRTDDFGNVNVSTPKGEQLSNEEKEIIRMYRGLDGELQRRTLAYIRRLNDAVGDESNVTSLAKNSIQTEKRHR